MQLYATQSTLQWKQIDIFNPLMGRGVSWLHYAIQV